MLTVSSIITVSLLFFQISMKWKTYLISPRIKQIVPDLIQAWERDTVKHPFRNILPLTAIIIPFLSLT